MEKFYDDDFERRSRDNVNNWKLRMNLQSSRDLYPPRISSRRNDDFNRSSRSKYAFQESRNCRDFERYHYYKPDRHNSYMSYHRQNDIHKSYRESEGRHQNYFPHNHNNNGRNYSAHSHRNKPDFDEVRRSCRNVQNNIVIDVLHKDSDQHTTISKVTEKDPKEKIPQLNPEAAKKEALAAELKKSLRKFQKTHSQNRSKLLVIEKSTDSNKAESTNQPQTCFPWDLPLTVDDLKSIGRGKTGNIEVCADSCSENELYSLEKQNSIHQSEIRGESAIVTSPEIEIIKQCRKRKVSESIEQGNSKKKLTKLHSRRRHHSASPSLCEEIEVEDEEGNNHQVGNNAPERDIDSSVAKTPRIQRSTKPAPSLMQLLGVRRREFSEMVDQPRNPRVQFMLNLLMKRHKELLLQTAIRSRFSTVGEESEAESNQAESNANKVRTETENSGDPTLESMGHHDTIDELSNILLDSSLTVDISSLPPELIDQLGSFLEMEVDLSNFANGLDDVGESAFNATINVNQIQEKVPDDINLSSLLISSTQKVDSIPAIKDNLSNQARGSKEVSKLISQSCIRNRTVGKKRSPKRQSPQTRGKTKLTEETLSRVEKIGSPVRFKTKCVEDNFITEGNSNARNEPSALHSSSLGEIRNSVNESVTLQDEFETRSIGSLGFVREENTIESNDHLPSVNSGNPIKDISHVSAAAEKLDIFLKTPLKTSLSLTSPADSIVEEETEEKLLSKMWEIDQEIGKLMEKKQELYQKLNQMRSLKSSSHSHVPLSIETQESVHKSTVSNSVCINTEVLVTDQMTENLFSKSAVIDPPSHPSTPDSHSCHFIEGRNLEISSDGCGSAKSGDVEMGDDSDNVSSNGQVDEMCAMNSKDGESNLDHSKDKSLEVVNNLIGPPNIIQHSGCKFSGHKETVLSIKVAKNFLYAACADFTICSYSLQTMKVEKRYYGHTKMITSLYVDSGHHLVSIYSGSHDKKLLRFKAQTGDILNNYDLDEPITCMEQSWGILFIGTKEGSIEKFNILKSFFIKPKMTSLKSEVMAIQASKEGPRRILIVATRDKPIIVRDSGTGLILRSINESATQHTVYTIHSVNGLVYTGSSIFGLTAWDFTNGKLVKQYEDCGTIVEIKVQNGKIYAASYDGNIYIYDCLHLKPKHIIKAADKMLLCLAVRNNKIYAGSLDKKLQVWKSPC